MSILFALFGASRPIQTNTRIFHRRQFNRRLKRPVAAMGRSGVQSRSFSKTGTYAGSNDLLSFPKDSFLLINFDYIRCDEKTTTIQFQEIFYEKFSHLFFYHIKLYIRPAGLPLFYYDWMLPDGNS